MSTLERLEISLETAQVCVMDASRLVRDSVDADPETAESARRYLRRSTEKLAETERALRLAQALPLPYPRSARENW